MYINCTSDLYDKQTDGERNPYVPTIKKKQYSHDFIIYVVLNKIFIS